MHLSLSRTLLGIAVTVGRLPIFLFVLLLFVFFVLLFLVLFVLLLLMFFILLSLVLVAVANSLRPSVSAWTTPRIPWIILSRHTFNITHIATDIA